MRVLLYLIVFLSSAALADQTYEWDDVERVVAVGDIHGAYPELIELLTGNGIIDADLNWTAGETHLVSLGDLLDRGAQSRAVMNLFLKLTRQASAAGGRMHVLLGNHELMNLSGDLRDVSEGEFQAFGGLAGHRAAFAVDGMYGAWLQTLPAAIRINRTLFLHGGLSPVVAGDDLVRINSSLTESLTTVLQEAAALREAMLIEPTDDLLALAEDKLQATSAEFQRASANPLFGVNGPLWYRGNALCHPVLEAGNVSARLQQFGVDRIVIAHTPTFNREVTARLDGKIVMADTGMLKSAYRGNARLLEFTAAGMRIFDEAGNEQPLRTAEHTDPELETLAIEGTADESDTVLLEGDVSARRERLRASARRRALAAYRLDRLLDVHMVPATAARTIDGREGLLIAQPARLLTEAQRVEQQLYRPNHCYGTSAYALLAAFDALLGFRTRNADNLAYALPSWQLHLRDTHKALGGSSALPQYAAPPQLPAGFAERISKLNREQLEEEFDGLLKKNEIKALLKRRDAILEWPRTP